MKKLLMSFFCSATVFVAIFMLSGCLGRLSSAESGEPSDVSGDVTPGGDTNLAETYEVRFVIDGETVSVQTYSSKNCSISEPEIPSKAGYEASWERYTLSGGNITVNAVYSPVDYTINYFADGSLLQVLTCTVENFSCLEPDVPQKPGYNGSWVYSFDEADNAYVAVAEYALVPFTVSFFVDGKLFYTVECNVENCEIYPEIPLKEHFTAEWEEFVYDGGDVEVNAIYTPIVYTVSFVVSDSVIASAEYTVLDGAVTEPAVPAKLYYNGEWEEYSLSGGNLTVNAVYAPVNYRVSFYADGNAVAEFEYNVESVDFDIPEVPLKSGYEGSWESFALTGGNICVNAVYSAVKGTFDLNYIRSSDGWKVSAYSGSETEIVIPAVYEGLPVTEIADEAFVNCRIVKLNVCEGVRTIGNSAFSECSYLSEVILPESLEEIGESAFSGCTVLENIALPRGIKTLSAYAFSRSGLTGIRLPENLNAIGEGAFYFCLSLKSIEIPAKVTYIGRIAFAGCGELESIIFKGAIPEIGANAFYGCNKLKEY